MDRSIPAFHLKFMAIPVGSIVPSVVLSTTSVAAAQAQRDSSRTDSARTGGSLRGYPPGIQDNSFLIEEAYNQDPGVVQHISGFQRDTRGAAYASSSHKNGR